MLKNNFAAAKNAIEPLEQSQDFGAETVPEPGVQGNAFAGSRANYDDEMHHAMRGAIMNGDTGGNSSIANAGMRLAAKFGSAATQSEKDAEKSRAMYLQVMLADLNKRLNEIDDQLDTLSQIQNMMANGSFDPANDAAHLAMLQKIDEDMTLEQWNAMSEQERVDWVLESRLELQKERADIEEIKQEFRNIEADGAAFPLTEPFNVTNNIFDNEILENAAKAAEEKNKIEIDRHNLSQEAYEAIYEELYDDYKDKSADATTGIDSITENLPAQDQSEVSTYNEGSIGLTFMK